MKSIIDNQSLEEKGRERLQWFQDMMPLVGSLNDHIKKHQVFQDKVIAICMHIEPKTAVWIQGLLDGGAKHIYLVGCMGTTKADTAAYLSSLDRMTVLGKVDDTYEDHQNYLSQVMKHKIDLFLDNGASLILAHKRLKPDWQPIGANEETRSGRLMIEKEDVTPKYPVIVIDDSPVKQLLENAIGVGQSVVDGFMRATSLLLGGKQILIVGYGFCGSGVAEKFKGQGANVMVYDSNPTIRLKAKADGYYVDDLCELIRKADVIVTVTGSFDVIRPDHIPYFKDNVILANCGHYSFEIDVKGLKANAKITSVKKDIEKLTFTDKSAYLIAGASPVNLACGDGNPIEIMDLGLGLQSASAIRLLDKENDLVPGLQAVPRDIDEKISIDMLTLLK